MQQGEISFLRILLKETAGPARCVQVLSPFVKNRSAPSVIPEESLLCNWRKYVHATFIIP